MTNRLPRATLVFCTMLGSIVFLAQTVVSGVGDTDSLAAILENYIQASGGDALRDVQTERRTGTLLRFQAGPVPLEVTARAPGLWRYDQTFAWGDQISCGFDGTNAWVADMHSVKAMEPHQFSDMQLLFDPQAPLKMRTLYPEMTVSGKGEIGEKEVTTVTAISADGRTTELAFDKDSGLLLRAGQMYFEDYRPDGAITRPHKILLGENDSTHFQMVMQFSKMETEVEIDDSRFRYPNCV
ncbi:MAG: hypothetical protein NTW07_01330, partial [candidate division Zixibacteria bacterium]|nr:hypothetical protein [candidate division Zixibacteria bacterium]